MATSKRSRLPFVLGGAALLLLLVIIVLPSTLVELLWLDSLGYTSVYWEILLIEVGLFASVFVLVSAFFGVNFWVLLRRLPPLELTRWNTGASGQGLGDISITRAGLRRVVIGLTLVFGFLFASGFTAQWEDVIRFFSGTAYGQVDPLFGKDLAFYMLRLPFIETLQDLAVGLPLLALLVLVAVYLLIGDFVVKEGRIQTRPKVVRHLSVNFALLLLAWGWGFYLDRFELLHTPGGDVVYGASYTDVHVVIPALWVLVVLSVLLALVVLVNTRLQNLRLLGGGALAYVLVVFLGLTLVPGLVQQFTVEPNELEVERPYLQHNIDLTREAYGLDEVQTRSYPAESDITLQEVEANETTLRNIRLWDPRLIIETYRQIQEIRLYYQFYEVDIDRYEINGETQQVLLSGRELTQDLPQQADTWFNRHLQYTHGYGLVMSPVAQVGEEGVPQLYIRDIPPVVDVEGLNFEQPAIYYGERTATYRIVDSEAEELHYPQGDDNVYNHYDGTGGVGIGSFWSQLLFAWTFSDYNIILSDYINSETRIQFWNRVQERVRRVAPFLELDRDPYMVLAEDGRLYWIQDAYTTSQYFPYSEPTDRRFSYIRNSVKVVVDAYNGSVDFFVIDEDDPVIQAYREAFPVLFQPIEEMPSNLHEHLRYPQDLFEVQVNKYTRYHMTTPQVFYNNEDLWTRPQEQYGDREILMEPYYVLTRLPDEPELQFLLMTPMTPQGRANMIGWMAGKSDMPGYGELVVYELPKDKLIYGPNQVESRIDQSPEISEQLTLWDQSGSRVIRGNLIVVPIEDSFLYVEPVFLLAEGMQLPQMRRVIASYGERTAMEPSLEQALNALFGTRFVQPTGEPAPPTAQPAGPVMPRSTLDLPELENAREALQRAEDALRQGDLETFGREFESIRQALEALPEAQPPAPAPDTSAAQ